MEKTFGAKAYELFTKTAQLSGPENIALRDRFRAA